MRIDQSLWAVRFFKSRSLAALAIHKGHVQHPARPLKPSTIDQIGWPLLLIRPQRWTAQRIVLRALAMPRSRIPASRVPSFCTSELFPTSLPETPACWRSFPAMASDNQKPSKADPAQGRPTS